MDLCRMDTNIEGRRVARSLITELELAVLISVGLQLNSVMVGVELCGYER